MSKKVVVIGDAFADLTTHIVAYPKNGDGTYGTPLKRNGGGTSANIAAGLGVLGADVSLICRVGNDDIGSFICEGLKNANVDTKGICIDDKNSSGSVLIAVDPSGERSIWVLSKDSAYEKLSSENMSYLDEVNPSAIFISGFMMGVHPAEEAIFEAVYKWRDKAKIYFDPNLRYASDAIPKDVKSSMQKMCSLCDIVLTGEGEMNCLELKQHENQTFIVKKGKEGSYLMNSAGGEEFTVPPTEHKAIDATGAGDSYAAAFVYSDMQGKSIKDSMEFATVAAGISVTIPGARSMSSLKEIEDYLKIYRRSK